jgi:EvpB/VC_A0108, tail sheath gpW/gp25-like domain
LQRYLSDWIMQYVHGAPQHASHESKSRLPLAEARIQVFEDDDNLGHYRAQVYLKPHFQLEGVDIAAGVSVRLPYLRACPTGFSWPDFGLFFHESVKNSHRYFLYRFRFFPAHERKIPKI